MIKLKNILLETITYKIYCDMDGVLSDFDSDFMKLSGGIASSRYENKNGAEKFWKLIDEKGGLEFWSKMSWMSDGKKLWNFIKDKAEILSAPAKSLPNSPKGKKIWINRELGNVKLNLVRAKNKQDYANSNSILIDDMKINIDQWKSKGGIGILHKSAGHTIAQLKKLGI